MIPKISNKDLYEHCHRTEDEEMLEDLIMAAILDGYKKADAVYEEHMGKFGMAGGMGGLL